MTSHADIPRAVQLLRQGRLVAFPTETVYGLGADATNPAAIELIYRTKGRPNNNPLIVHVADVGRARRVVARWPAEAQRLSEHFWPGPLTLVLPKASSIPDNVTAGLGTVGVRVPRHPLALELLRGFDGPLAAPSANRSTQVSPTTARHVRDEFAGNAEPSLILDGGPCEVGIESTVLDLTGASPMILRPGGISRERLEEVVGGVIGVGWVVESVAAKSPGQQETHYAPRARAYSFPASSRELILQRAGNSTPVLLRQALPEDRRIVVMPALAEEYARVLYRTLRELDDRGVAEIYIELPPDTAEWLAVRDRLARATKPAVII